LLITFVHFCSNHLHLHHPHLKVRQQLISSIYLSCSVYSDYLVFNLTSVHLLPISSAKQTPCALIDRERSSPRHTPPFEKQAKTIMASTVSYESRPDPSYNGIGGSDSTHSGIGANGGRLDVEKQQNGQHRESAMEKPQPAVPGAPAAPAAPAMTFPDGGWEAWSVVLGSALVFTAGVGFINSYSVFQSYYRLVTLPNHSNDAIAWIGSIQLWGAFGLGIPAGLLLDLYGPKVSLRVPLKSGT
jgi:hypothetical protein